MLYVLLNLNSTHLIALRDKINFGLDRRTIDFEAHVFVNLSSAIGTDVGGRLVALIEKLVENRVLVPLFESALHLFRI